MVLELEAELAEARAALQAARTRADAAVEETHRRYRRDLVPLQQSLVVFRPR